MYQELNGSNKWNGSALGVILLLGAAGVYIHISIYIYSYVYICIRLYICIYIYICM
jgi:hypothetical protein